MTYRQLLRILQNRPDSYLDDDITIYNKVEDEFYPVFNTSITGRDLETDVLDDDLLVLNIS